LEEAKEAGNYPEEVLDLLGRLFEDCINTYFSCEEAESLRDTQFYEVTFEIGRSLTKLNMSQEDEGSPQEGRTDSEVDLAGMSWDDIERRYGGLDMSNLPSLDFLSKGNDSNE
jgi:hypothetical protein